MPATLAASLRILRFVVCAFILQTVAASAAEPIDFDAALAEAIAQCRAALVVLEIDGPEETAAEVQRFRESWQDIVERFGGNRPQRYVGDQAFSTLLVDIEVRTVGALIIINAGRQDAARNALVGIEQTLAGIAESTTPQSTPQ